MRRNIACKTLLAAVACTTCVTLAAQEKKYPQPEQMKPGMSEYWTPQPAVVTPGNIQTNTAPSDAIVLFDGKDLSAWESARDGSPAQWTVQNGVFTVNKKSGDIQTKQNLTTISCISNGVYPKTLPAPARVEATVESSCKECMKYRFSTIITAKPM